MFRGRVKIEISYQTNCHPEHREGSVYTFTLRLQFLHFVQNDTIL